MDTTTAQERRAKYYDPKNVIYRKIAGRYGWAWNCIGMQIIVAQGLASVIMIIMTVFLTATSGDPNVAASLMQYSIPIAALSFCIGNPLAAFISLKMTKAARFRDYFHKPKIGAGLIALGVLATFGISSVDSIIMTFFKSIFAASSQQLGESISNGVFSDNIFLSVVSVAYVCVLGPFFEELLCRGAIQTLGGHISPKFAVFVSALMFGIFHLNISQFYNAFLLGLLFGYITLRAGSIWPSVIMHIANNSWVVLTMFIVKDMNEEQATRFDWNATIVWAVIGVIALIAFIVIEKKNKNKEMVVMINNKPATEEEVALTEKTVKQLTVKSFFTCWQSFVVIAFFLFMCLVSNLMGA